MKRIICTIVLLLSAVGIARAEAVLDESRMNVIYEFAQDYGGADFIRSIYESALQGEIDTDKIGSFLKNMVRKPVHEVIQSGMDMLPVILLMTVLGCAGGEKSGGAHFMLLMMLVLSAIKCTKASLVSASECISAVKTFTDAVSPLLVFLLSAMGMNTSAAFISPAAALAGNIAVDLFLNCGLPLCRAGLCISAAGNLCPEMELERFSKLIEKTAIWASGLAVALFTSLLALKSNVSVALDGIGVRTAKYAVDSAVPIIGSGVSDAWESYISGMFVAKNAAGISGIAAVILSGLRPVLICLLSMFMLNAASALLAALGERKASAALTQIAGICQMALSFCTASMAIIMILFGAVMAAGKSMLH